ncbi:hypothetical protein H0H92_009313 [Tricholoma furcatifolium]|nr:hypothetical protein H0H92_009313 [Tricholoma furcatifolium]
MTTSNTAHLPGGIDLFYSDSGAPLNSSDYTTVVILHGSGFNGQNLTKLHAYAHALNLRTVIPNRRDYAGSTPYTAEDLEDLNSGRSAFLDRIGIQLAQFLLWFIKQYRVPKLSNDRQKGGIVVMGWSLGNTSALTVFSDKIRRLLGDEMYGVLEEYLRDMIIYDATLFAVGWKSPPVPFEPLSTFSSSSDPSKPGLPPDEVTRNFNVWLSSYYDHPENPQSVDELHFAQRTDLATSDSWTQDELENFSDNEAFVRSELPMYQPQMQSSVHDLSDGAFGLKDTSALAFPRCRVIVLRPTRTTWRCYWFGIEVQRVYNENRREGKNMRPVISIPIQGGNHFAHWDFPEKVMKAAALGILDDGP